MSTTTPSLFDLESHLIETREFFLAHFSNEPHITQDVRAWLSIYPCSFVNVVTRCSLAQDKATSFIATIKDHAHQYKVPVAWFVGPSGSPDIGSQLLKQGFISIGQYPMMACQLLYRHFTPRADIVIKPLDKTNVAEWAAILDQAYWHNLAVAQHYANALQEHGFSSDDVQHVVAYKNGIVAGVGSVYMRDTWAGIFHMATHPDYARQGIASHVLDYLLAQATQHACNYAVLMSAPGISGLYEKSGFKQIGMMHIYRFTPEK